MHTYEVLVGNIGCVISTSQYFKAAAAFGTYERELRAGIGRGQGSVTLLKDGEVLREYTHAVGKAA